MPAEGTSSASADPPSAVIDLRLWLADSFERGALPSPHVAFLTQVSDVSEK
jgi:hypothetical protein